MRIVILGSGGRLGAALCREYGKGHAITGFAHRDLDLAQPGAVKHALVPLEFDAAINCAALTNVDYCETHEAEAMQVNAHAVRELAEVCSGKNARLIHISTDYVFDGEKQTPYTEEDAAEPISVYGASKLQGEIELLAVSERHLALRVSWVFGPDRPSFIDMIIKRALETDRVEAIADKYSAPSYTRDIAGLLRPFLGDVREGGILHLCNAGECTWREYGQHGLDCAAAAGLELKARTVEPLALAGMKSFVARRPVNTVLSTEKLTRLTGHTPRSWQAAVEEYVREEIAARPA